MGILHCANFGGAKFRQLNKAHMKQYTHSTRAVGAYGTVYVTGRRREWELAIVLAPQHSTVQHRGRGLTRVRIRRVVATAPATLYPSGYPHPHMGRKVLSYPHPRE
jgi:hypothetical protein